VPCSSELGQIDIIRLPIAIVFRPFTDACRPTDSTLLSGLFSLPFAPADSTESAVQTALRAGSNGTTEAFIAGPENALVRAAAAAVAAAVLPTNPIVLYGPLGVGKSSLARSLAARRRERLWLDNVIVTTGVDLARSLAHAIEMAAVADLRARHHRCDLLLIDDVHRLAGKPAAQQFLLAAIDALIRRGSLVIATMRQAPQATAGLSRQLLSRLCGGLIVNLALPGVLARQELVRQAATKTGLSLTDDNISRLAGSSDTRPARFATAAKLRHAVLQLAAASEFGPRSVTANSVTNSVEQLIADETPSAKSIVRQVSSAVARHFALSAGELKGKSRRQTVAEARSLAMYIVRQLSATPKSAGSSAVATTPRCCMPAARQPNR
jgi:chromosomal replication initiator protein